MEGEALYRPWRWTRRHTRLGSSHGLRCLWMPPALPAQGSCCFSGDVESASFQAAAVHKANVESTQAGFVSWLVYPRRPLRVSPCLAQKSRGRLDGF